MSQVQDVNSEKPGTDSPMAYEIWIYKIYLFTTHGPKIA